MPKPKNINTLHTNIRELIIEFVQFRGYRSELEIQF